MRRDFTVNSWVGCWAFCCVTLVACGSVPEPAPKDLSKGGVTSEARGQKQRGNLHKDHALKDGSPTDQPDHSKAEASSEYERTPTDQDVEQSELSEDDPKAISAEEQAALHNLATILSCWRSPGCHSDDG